MKKSTVLCTALSAALVLTGCSKSQESAYRKAYEKAQSQESTNTEVVEETVVVAPVVTTPVEETVVTDNVDNVSVRQEKLTVVSGDGLKAYSVVVGSFSLKTNADGLQQTLINAGYSARLAYNSDRNMYRVVATSFDDKASAVQSRNSLRSQYPDAWLLYSE